MNNIYIRFGSIGDLTTFLNDCYEFEDDYIFNRLNFRKILKNKYNKANLCELINFYNSKITIIDSIFEILFNNKFRNKNIIFIAHPNTSFYIRIFLRLIFFKRNFKIIKFYSQYFHKSLKKSNTVALGQVKSRIQNGIKKIAFAPHGKEPAKNINFSTFMKLVRELKIQKSVEIYLISDYFIEIDETNEFNILNFSGRTSLKEMIELIKSSDLFIGADSGPLHIAASLSVPSVAFFSARISPEFWSPIHQGVYIIYDDLCVCANCNLIKCKYPVNFCINSEENIVNFSKQYKRLETPKIVIQ